MVSLGKTGTLQAAPVHHIDGRSVIMIEQEMGRAALDSVKTAALIGADVTSVAAQLLFELHKHQKLRQGLGELSLEALQKSLNRKNGEGLAFTSVTSDVYQDMRSTGILSSGGLRNYSVIAAKNTDQIMIFYGSADQKYMDQILSAMDAMYGSKSDIEKDVFFNIAKDRDIFVLQDISSEEAELFKYYSLLQDENGNIPGSMPYSVVNLNGRRCLLCLDSDVEVMQRNMQYVAATFTSQQGARILEDIRIRLKGRQERQIAVEQAKREHLIIDADNPYTRIEVTAHDYDLYKGKMLVDSIPISDRSQLSRVCSIVDGMSSPVVVGKAAYEKLSASEQQEYLHSPKASELPKTYEHQLEIDMDQVLAKLNDVNELREYLNHMTGYSVKVSGDEIGDVIRAFEKEQKKRNKVEKNQHREGGSEIRQN